MSYHNVLEKKHAKKHSFTVAQAKNEPLDPALSAAVADGVQELW